MVRHLMFVHSSSQMNWYW